jgi:hypothetical protein
VAATHVFDLPCYRETTHVRAQHKRHPVKYTHHVHVAFGEQHGVEDIDFGTGARELIIIMSLIRYLIALLTCLPDVALHSVALVRQNFPNANAATYNNTGWAERDTVYMHVYI